MKINKILAIIIAISVIFMAGFLYFLNRRHTTGNLEKITTENEKVTNRFEADLNGDGAKESFVLDIPSDASGINGITAYDTSGKEIGKYPEGMPLPHPLKDQTKVVRLKLDAPKEYVSFEFIAGPHQSETMFIGLYKDKLLPVCHVKDFSQPDDCVFYSGEVGRLQVVDLDNDNFVEVVEYVDEYPADGTLSKEEQDAIDKVSNEKGNEYFASGASRIAIREKGGRGRTVVWGIYKFNGRYFDPVSGKDFDTYFAIIAIDQTNFIKRSQLNEDSLDYINFAKKFWSKRQ